MYTYFCERDNSDKFPYTDLACERHRADLKIDGVSFKKEVSRGGIWERIVITSKEGEKSIGRPLGTYDTLYTSRFDILDSDSILDTEEEIARELCYLCDKNKVTPERILVVGLGNGNLTPDSVGTIAAKEVRATMHIKAFDKEYFDGLECSEIAVCAPGVTSQSGLDASVILGGICKSINPDLIILIDALVSSSHERLGATFQLCDTGIAPGSGLGNSRARLDKQSLGATTISIGVPTVIDARVLAGEGTAPQIPKGMFVSPKEITEICQISGKIIGNAINQAFGLFT